MQLPGPPFEERLRNSDRAYPRSTVPASATRKAVGALGGAALCRRNWPRWVATATGTRMLTSWLQHPRRSALESVTEADGRFCPVCHAVSSGKPLQIVGRRVVDETPVFGSYEEVVR